MVLMVAVTGAGDTSNFGGRRGGCNGDVVVAGCDGNSCHGGGFLGLRNRDRGGCHGTGGGCTGAPAPAPCCAPAPAPAPAPCCAPACDPCCDPCKKKGLFARLFHRKDKCCPTACAPACDPCAGAAPATPAPTPPVTMPTPMPKKEKE
jgi:hypothetical protein